jgi:hypothetical protein
MVGSDELFTWKCTRAPNRTTEMRHISVSDGRRSVVVTPALQRDVLMRRMPEQRMRVGLLTGDQVAGLSGLEHPTAATWSIGVEAPMRRRSMKVDFCQIEDSPTALGDNNTISPVRRRAPARRLRGGLPRTQYRGPVGYVSADAK